MAGLDEKLILLSENLPFPAVIVLFDYAHFLKKGIAICIAARRLFMLLFFLYLPR